MSCYPITCALLAFACAGAARVHITDEMSAEGSNEKEMLDALSELGLTQAVSMFSEGPNRLEAAVHNGATSVEWATSLLTMPALVQTQSVIQEIYARGPMMTQTELDTSTESLKAEMSAFTKMLASIDEAMETEGWDKDLQPFRKEGDSNKSSTLDLREARVSLSKLLTSNNYTSSREIVESMRSIAATVDSTVSKCTDDKSLNLYHNLIGAMKKVMTGQSWQGLGALAHNVLLQQKQQILVKYMEAVLCPSIYRAIREIAKELMKHQFSEELRNSSVSEDTIQKFVFLVSTLLDKSMPEQCQDLYQCGKRRCPKQSFTAIIGRISGKGALTCMCGNSQCRVNDDRTRSGFGCRMCGHGCDSPEAQAQCRPNFVGFRDGCIKDEVGQQMVLGSAAHTRALLRQNLYVDPMTEFLADFVEDRIGRGLAKIVAVSLGSLANIRKDATAVYSLFSASMAAVAATQIALAGASPIGAVIAVGTEFVKNPAVLSGFFYIKARISQAKEISSADGFCAKAAAKLSGIKGLSEQTLRAEELAQFSVVFADESDRLSAMRGRIHQLAMEAEAHDIFEEANAGAPGQTQPMVVPTQQSMADKLRDLKSLLDEGILSQAEFDAQKAKVLGA